MKKIFFMLIIGILVLNLAFASSHGEEDFAKAEEIIRQKIPCENLSEEQLEIIGDYYMEQMHPGEAHEYMDEMMGGEGSESLRIVHINIARNFYCGEHNAVNSGMMNMIMGRNMPAGMGGMMGYSNYPYNYNNYNRQDNFLRWIFLFISLIIIGLIVMLIVRLAKPGKK